MLWALITFHMSTLQQQLLSGHYREEIILDEQHPHYRRLSKRYKKKLETVKTFWIVAGMIILLFPLLHVAMISALITTFLSFCFLDETQ